MKINLSDLYLETLLDDLTLSPLLGTRRNYITLFPISAGVENIYSFRTFVSLCSDLLEVKFKYLSSNYIQALDHQDTKLPKIQYIYLNDVYSTTSIPSQVYYLQVNYQFRSTLHLQEIAMFNSESFNKVRNYPDGITEFISEFPNLKTLEVCFYFSQGVDDTDFVNFIRTRSQNI